MRIRWLALTALVLAAACSTKIPGVGCDDDADCSAGRCVDHVCVHQIHCRPDCEAHQDCVEGACVPAFDAIRIVSPAPNARLVDGFEASAELVAHAGTTRALPGELEVRLTPVSGTEIDATLALDPVARRYSGRIEAGRGGAFSLRVAYPDSSLAAEISIQIDRCGEQCAPDRECYEESCAPAFDQITFESPKPGSWNEPPLVIEARLHRAAGALRSFPARLDARATDPAGDEHAIELSHAGDGLYRGEIGAAGGGMYRLRAWIEGGELAAEIEVTVNVCATNCVAGLECLGDACLPPFSGVEIVAPHADESLPLDFLVDARLVRTPGSRTPWPATLAMSACRAGTGCVPATLPRADDSGLYSGRMRVAVGARYAVNVELAAAGLTASVPVYVDVCAAVCDANEVCLEQSCQLAFTAIALAEPADGTRVDADIAVTATMTSARKTIEPPASLKLQAQHIASGAIESATLAFDSTHGGYLGTFAPTKGGAFELRAVWVDGANALLASAPVRVIATRCEADCGAWKECIDGVCTDVYRGVVLDAPTANSTQGPSVRVRAHLDRALPSAKPNPTSLQGSASHGATAGAEETFPLAQVGSSDDYEGTWSPVSGGGYQVVVRAVETGQQSAAVSVTIDRTPPEFAIAWSAPTRRANEIDPATGYAATLRRDEVVVVTVTSPDSDVDAATVELRIRGATGTGSRTVALVPSAGACAGTCLEASVDLADPTFEMKAFRGQYTAEVTGRDVRGNQAAAPATASIPVTRWKWAYDGQSGPIKTAPAIGATGRVYVGTALNAAPWGKVLALNADGTLAWSFQTDGPVEASVAVGTVSGIETAIVAGTRRNTSSSIEGAIWALDGSSSVIAPTCTGGTKSSASIGTTYTQFPGDSTPVLSGVGLFESGTTSQIVAVRLGNTSLQCLVAYPSGEPEPSAAIGISQNSVFFVDKIWRVQSMQLSSIGAWATVTGWPLALGTGLRPTGVITNSTSVLGGAAGGGIGAFFRIPFTGGSATTIQTATSIKATVLDSTHNLLAGADDGQLHSAPELMTSHTAVPLSTLPSDNTIAVAAPAIGSDATLYIATQGGKLLARTSTGAAIWEAPLGAGSDSSPALDCARDSTGAAISRPGVLYVGADDGKLYSFIVDSHGLDTTAPWPKFHRDPQNSADASRSLSQFTCP